MVKNLNIFIISASWLKDRQRVITEFQKQIQKYFFKNIKTTTIKVITEYDPNDITGELIQKSVNYTHFKEEDDLKDDNKSTSFTFYNQFIKNMHLFQLSCVLKHTKAIEHIVNNSGDDDINLILEDDIVYQESMCMMLEKVMESLPSDYDIAFLGLPTNKAIKDRNEIGYQNTSEIFKVLPYNDSYIISKTAAKKLYDSFLPIKFTYNIQLSYLIDKLALKTVLCLPSIFIDGSKLGMFLSTLTPNNALLFNNDYMQTKNILDNKKDLELTEEETNKLDKTFAESPIKNHPDFLHLRANYLTKQKKYKEAEGVFEEGLKIYSTNSCVVNHESLYLKDYIRLYKNMQ
jgi:GR25 family glycosyltransferase involved in LPS biosynthesis